MKFLSVFLQFLRWIETQFTIQRKFENILNQINSGSNKSSLMPKSKRNLLRAIFPNLGKKNFHMAAGIFQKFEFEENWNFLKISQILLKETKSRSFKFSLFAMNFEYIYGFSFLGKVSSKFVLLFLEKLFFFLFSFS